MGPSKISLKRTRNVIVLNKEQICQRLISGLNPKNFK